MRVQNISQNNNYQNNNQNKNIGFKSHIIYVEGLTRSGGRLYDDVDIAFLRGIGKTLRKRGILFHPERNPIVQRLVRGGTELLVMDASDAEMLANAKPDKAQAVMSWILRNAGRSETSWSELA